MIFKTYEEVIEKLDWDLLQKQKRTLERLIIGFPSENLNDLWGLVELIENLQDVNENEETHEGYLL